MDGSEIRQLEKSDQVKIITLQIEVAVDARFNGQDASKALAEALSEPDVDHVPFQLERANLRLTLKLRALDRMEAMFEDMTTVTAVKEEVRDRATWEAEDPEPR